MSYLRDKAKFYLQDYDKSKTGKWTKQSSPPENHYSYGEMTDIVDKLMILIDGELANKFIGKET